MTFSNKLFIFFSIVLVLFLVTIPHWSSYNTRPQINKLITLTPPQGLNNTETESGPTNFPQGADLSFPLQAPSGFRIKLFADLKKYGSPRVLAFDPDNVLVVSLTSQGRVIALPDRNIDGLADQTVTIANNLNKPHGIEFANGKIFIAESDKVVSYDYDATNFKLTNKNILFTLPGGGRHFTRTLKIYNGKLYTSVGSSCDTCVEKDWRRASILISNLDGSDLRTYASGLRNTVFFAFDQSGKLWGNDMGRDYLGDTIPPDEVNVIEVGKDYGWPKCYGNNIHDTVFDRSMYDFAEGSSGNVCDSLSMTKSTFNYPAHVAPLGITFINSRLFNKSDQGNILSALHGSWNSSVPVGYKIIKLTVKDNMITGTEDFITGFQNGNTTLGRPVDLAFDKNGILYISDDKANFIYILTK